MVNDVLANHVVAFGRTYREAEQQGNLTLCVLHGLLTGFDTCTGVLYVEDGFQQQTIDPALQQGSSLFLIDVTQLFVAEVCSFHRDGLAGGSHASHDVTRLLGVGQREGVSHLACQLCGSDIDVAALLFQSEGL